MAGLWPKRPENVPNILRQAYILIPALVDSFIPVLPTRPGNYFEQSTAYTVYTLSASLQTGRVKASGADWQAGHESRAVLGE